MNQQERSDDRAAFVGASIALAMIAQQVAGKATRDAFFLDNFAAAELPQVMTTTSVAALLSVLLASRLLARFSPARFTPAVFVFHGVAFVVEWWLSGINPRTAAWITYLHTGALGGTSISAFWSLINERFDPHAAKRLFGRIGAGATAGGILGGLASWGVSKVAEVATMLLILSAVNFVCAAALSMLGRRATSAASSHGELAEPRNLPLGRILKETPYLWHLAGVVALAALADALIEFVFKSRASQHYEGGKALISFFSVFYTISGIVTFLLQAGAARYLLQKLGLAGTAATLPGATLVTSVVGLFVPGFWSALSMRLGSMTTEHSLFRSSYELAYTPLPPEKKRPTKTLIDVGSGKLAAAAGGGLALGFVAILPEQAVAVAATATVVLSAALALVLTRSLRRGYVTALVDSLRSGAIELGESELADATTRKTFADSMALDRNRLLQEIARRAPAPGAEGALLTGPAAVGPGLAAPPPDPIADALADLRSHNPVRVRRALVAHDPLPRMLVAAAIEALALDSTLPDVLTSLRKVADHNTGVLVDMLLAAETPFPVRRRLPRVLRACKTQMAVDGLLAALDDPRFEVRYRAGAALLRVLARNPTLKVEADKIVQAALAETARGGAVWNNQTVEDMDSGDDSSPFADEAVAAKVGRSLTHVFTILACIHDPEPLHLAFAALAAEDPGLRGTGLEYLEMILTPELRERLGPYLADKRVVRKAARPQGAVLEDLMNSRDSLIMNRAALAEILRNRGGADQ